MASFQVTGPGRDDWRRLQRAGDAIVTKTVELTAMEFWRNIRIQAPVDTGRLASSFIAEQRSETEFVIRSGVNYARAVHEGRDPGPAPFGPIAEWARRHGLPAAPVWLAIQARGTRPNPYVTRAWEDTSPRIPEFGRRALREAKEQFGG